MAFVIDLDHTMSQPSLALLRQQGVAMARHDWVVAVSVAGTFLLALGAICILLSM
jgi:hypothetical protein